MIDNIQVSSLIFIDIETAPNADHIDKLSAEERALWHEKMAKWNKDELSDDAYYESRAGIYAEFGKVICIVLGLCSIKNGEIEMIRLKSWYGDDEKDILSQFRKLLFEKLNNPYKYSFCGHNIKEFDIPFLCRRMLANDLTLPAMLNISGMKPWEVPFLDTLQLWKFGDYKHYTSLKLIAHTLGIPSPKDDIEGKDVGRVFWKDGDLDRIVRYCRKDVVTVANLILKLKGMKLIQEDQIQTID